MARVPRPHWLKRMISLRTGSRRTDLSKQQRSRPRIELLEARWVLSTVTNLNDAGAGSLRQAILDTPTGGMVDFQPGLTGTIVLTSGELVPKVATSQPPWRSTCLVYPSPRFAAGDP